MLEKINTTLENIQLLGHTEEEYTQVFRLLNETELALLEKMEFLNRLKENELSLINSLVNKILDLLHRKFPKPGFEQLLSA
jgi:hypothetical protein